MRFIKLHQTGVTYLIVLLGVAVLLAAGVIGWKVWDSSQTDQTKKSAIAANKKTAKPDTAKKQKFVPPADWVRYEGGSISFYYPSKWNKDEFVIQSFGLKDPIPSGYGTPDSKVFDAQSKKWLTYINYGTPDQKLVENNGEGDWQLKIVSSPASPYPVTYYQSGHAAGVTHDILVIHDTTVYRVRLPMLNSFNEGWEAALAEQKAVVKDIIASIQFDAH